MIPSAFEYHRATSLDDAARVLATHAPTAKLLAGGHSLIPAMKLRLATPSMLVDIGGLSDLRYIKRNKKHLTIGTLTPHADVAESSEVQRGFRGLAEAAAAIGDVQVRNCGTIGGSLAHADVSADYPAAVLAFEADIIVKSAKGARSIPAFKFFTGLFTTELAEDEIVTEVRFPDPGDAGSAYEKFFHPASGYAVVGVCVVASLDKRGVCKQARVAATGVADRPVRLSSLEMALKGSTWDADRLRTACENADADVRDVREDLFAKADYRRHLLRVVARRAAERAGTR